jgi:hypothetical protein
MKQLLSLFLFLLPCLAWAQYPSNGNQKITLGEQTTADGLIFRGVLADTGIITPSSDTSAYIILDTVNHRFYNYNRATNVWSMAGVGSISSGLTGTLPVANGGTGATTFTANQILKGNGTSSISNSNLFSSGTTLGLNTSTFPDFFPNNLHIQGTGSTGLALSSTDGNSFFQFVTLSTPGSRGPIIHNNGFRFAKAYGRSAEGYADIMILDTLLRVGINIGNDGNPTETLHVGGNARITGNVSVGSATPTASGTGITFPSTQSASTSANTLDDYEEGTWTPAYEGLAGSAGSLAYASGYPRGRYTKIGRLVVATGEIELTNKGSWTSGVQIAGLPFNISATEVAQGFCIAGYVDFAAGELYLNTRNTGAENALFYFDKTKDNAEREILFTTAVNNNSTFYFSLTYQTN